jgi:hypothetical protein
MTPLRLALIAVTELHKAGFLNTNVVNSPAKVVEAAICLRIALGDVVCIPDEQETAPLTENDGHGNEAPFFTYDVPLSTDEVLQKLQKDGVLQIVQR